MFRACHMLFSKGMLLSFRSVTKCGRRSSTFDKLCSIFFSLIHVVIYIGMVFIHSCNMLI
jgi:hypothetical protein